MPHVAAHGPHGTRRCINNGWRTTAFRGAPRVCPDCMNAMRCEAHMVQTRRNGDITEAFTADMLSTASAPSQV
eukprot:CAMPEP_0206326894 /NCGR_PEP_ID=MMETSP0106_2-20121207/21860_1 /ASSEMBLY_ACC=CAM_ASM_000206 /TAXON_ID=81532 /ORGANISM="Acanthoeca-like sp., Strain 10tr" /LENGTH=72 /DNA_ID=CAMNT_0053759479 /DNA_START=18 /DNA_END=236 /DNA_ORIENTATION=+